MKCLLIALLLLPIVSRAALPPEPIDAEIEKLKPRPADTFEIAKAKCKALAKESDKKGVKVLMMGIEGQGGFKADNTWLVYRYLWRITHGTPDKPPVLDTAAPVLNRLLLPLIDHYRASFEILNFPETAVTKKDGGIPEACAHAWMTKNKNARLILLGHSFGADAIHEVAERLGKRGIQVAQAYSIDAVARSPAKSFTKPENVGLWQNFLQRNEPPFGAYFTGAKNRDLSPLGVNHRTIVRSEPVISAIKENFGAKK